ncbi:maleylpyruvate isomerase family mycothiol-dependent enzyme [Micromonospora rifamycinica]|uniref:maleylpyruvate isomerase family mycothiol-dependent enzyme n=1 Tax=Micromonospora rifamycinica TaxID=291594 RepID=UPI00341E411C
MKYEELVRQMRSHAGSLQQVVSTLAPDAPVPTCPEWTVTGLVGHLGRVYDAALKGIAADPDGPRPAFSPPPTDWESASTWWKERGEEFWDRLDDLDPDAPAWVFSPRAPRRAIFWVRLLAHEWAMHRVDAEHAAAGPEHRGQITTFSIEKRFAADGVDEFLGVLIPAFVPRREPIERAGLVLLRATDLDRTWRVRLTLGGVPEVVEDDGTEPGVTVVGEADPLYRAVWGRPNTATFTGDRALLYGMRAL